MTEDKRTVRLPHSVTMNDRRNLSMTGVEEVIGCDEEQLTLKTSMGELTVDGNGLHIGSFNRSTGELKLDGVIRGIVYADAEPDKQGFLRGCLNNDGIHTLHHAVFYAAGIDGRLILGRLLRRFQNPPQNDPFS